jgi:hypothetical protein
MGMIFTRKVSETAISSLDAWLETKTEIELGGIPISAAFTYNLDQTVNTITKGSLVKSFTYNVDETVNTISDGTYLKTFIYNPDGTVDEIQVTVI